MMSMPLELVCSQNDSRAWKDWHVQFLHARNDCFPHAGGDSRTASSTGAFWIAGMTGIYAPLRS